MARDASPTKAGLVCEPGRRHNSPNRAIARLSILSQTGGRMSLLVRPEELPEAIPPGELASLAYPAELAEIGAAVIRRLSCLIECPKEVVPFVVQAIRSHLRSHELRCTLIDGRGPTNDRVPLLSSGLLGNMRQGLLDAVRGPQVDTVFVFPYLDLLAGGPTPTTEARELTILLVENPELLWVGFKDPATALPRMVEQLPLRRVRIGGVRCDRLRFLVTQKEGRKFGSQVDLARLHRCVSGLNVVQLRKYLAALDREDLPGDSSGAFVELRRLTLPLGLGVPDETFEAIGGYPLAKLRLREDILDVVARIDAATADDRGRVEQLLPRGILLAGPPGVGKRLFARAVANALGAVFLETTGAELKSRFVGGNEENLRLLFAKARQVAPAVILFKELDAFAARPTKGVTEPSLFLQLLQELDALPPGERVLVIGTTLTVEGLDSGLVQPGRFELVLELGPPTGEDRAEIVRRAASVVGLTLSDEAVTRATDLSANPPPKPPFHGARLARLCRGLARLRLRTGVDGPVTADEVTEIWGTI